MINEQMLATKLGQQWLDERFTVLALIYGSPQHKNLGARMFEFRVLLIQVLGLPTELLNYNEVTEWYERYTHWYIAQENIHAG
jgi:hypothetical protein